MISVEKALSIYTDNVTNGLSFDVNEFKDKMTPEDFEELMDLAKFTDLVLDTRSISRYQSIFENLNSYKESFYDMPSAANFRTDKGAPTDEAQKPKDKLFDEEFGDE